MGEDMAALTYDGICLGGPRDGQWIAARSNGFQVPVAKYCEVHEPALHMKVQYERYLWHNFGDYKFWWWVDRDDAPATPPNLMRRLLEGYRKPVLEPFHA